MRLINCIALAATATLGTAVDSSSPESTLPEQEGTSPLTTPLPEKATENEFVLAPIPFGNPAIGTGITMATAYLHRFPGQGTETPVSVLSAGAFYTDTNSWGVGAGQSMNFRKGDLRLAWAGAYGHLNVDYFFTGETVPVSVQVPIEQDFIVFAGQALHRIAGSLYTGVRGGGGRTEIHPGGALADRFPRLDEVSIPITQVGIGIPVQFDTRDSRFWPTSGSFGEVSLMRYDEILGSDVEYQSYSADWNQYLSWKPGQVLALRAILRGVAEGAPFYSRPSVGQGADLRGYRSGQYYDLVLGATQAEYRWHLHERWVLTGFAGVADVAPQIAEVGQGILFPAWGLGMRWIVAPSNGVSLRLDVASGKDDTLWYLSLGEAF